MDPYEEFLLDALEYEDEVAAVEDARPIDPPDAMDPETRRRYFREGI